MPIPKNTPWQPAAGFWTWRVIKEVFQGGSDVSLSLIFQPTCRLFG